MHKMKHRSFSLNIKTHFLTADDRPLEQVAQSGCGVSFLQGIHSPGQPAWIQRRYVMATSKGHGDFLLEQGGWTRFPSEIPSNLKHSLVSVI